MKISNITVKKTYQKDGVDRNVWLNVGSLIKFDATPDKPEQMIIELNMFPNQKFHVFENEKRVIANTVLPSSVNPNASGPIEIIKDINPDDIPF